MMKCLPNLKLWNAICFVTAFFCVSNLKALIGESVDQSDMRYGVPIAKGADWRQYKKSGLQIRAHFHDGFSDSLTYRKDLPDKLGKPEGISFEEIAVLLDNNSRGAEWKDLVKGYKFQSVEPSVWECKKPALHATYNVKNKSLSVEGTDFAELKKLYAKRVRGDSEKLLNALGV